MVTLHSSGKHSLPWARFPRRLTPAIVLCLIELPIIGLTSGVTAGSK